MKKLKHLALITALSLSTACTPVFAASAPADIEKAPHQYNEFLPEAENVEFIFAMNENEDAISILFNGEFAQLDEKPVNIDGRVKLPFRAFLENIGAKVDYDEASSKVSAERNGIKIEFTLNSDMLYIDNNGVKSEMKMDSPVEIINDRTFVPVRFMSEAFGLSVGWDDMFKSVIITDTDEYMKIISENCSNYMKFGEMQYALNENYQSDMKISLSFSLESDYSGAERIDMKADVLSAAQKDKIRTNSNNTFNFSAVNEGKVVELNDMRVDMILDNNKLYLSTNIAEILKNADPDDTVFAGIAAVITPDTWISGSLDELFKLIGVDEAQAEMLSSLFTEPQSFNKVFSSLYTSGVNSNSLTYAIASAAQVNTMKNMFGDDKFILKENEDGSYSFEYSFTNDDLAKYTAAIITGIGAPDEAIKEASDQISEMINISLTMSGNLTDKKADANVDMAFGMNIDRVNINAEIKAESDTEVGTADLSALELPTNTIDLSTIINLLM